MDRRWCSSEAKWCSQRPRWLWFRARGTHVIMSRPCSMPTFSKYLFVLSVFNLRHCSAPWRCPYSARTWFVAQSGDLSQAQQHLEEALRMQRGSGYESDNRARQYLEESLGMQRTLYGDKNQVKVTLSMCELRCVIRDSTDFVPDRKSVV